MPGSGLGLAIVAQVVDRHSGSVTAGESPAGGARLDASGCPGDCGSRQSSKTARSRSAFHTVSAYSSVDAASAR